MRIFLIGFMGSGKSYTGKRLAALFGCPFVDLDQWIEEHEGRPIAEIFKDAGEKYFRALERTLLREVVEHHPSQVVISCGGGTPCFFDNMEWMNENGATIFLDTTVEVLVQRLLPGIAKRPLLKNKSTGELRDFVQRKRSERLPIYQKAAITIRQDTYDAEPAREIYEYLRG